MAQDLGQNFKKWCESIVNGAKSAFGIGSHSAVMRDEVGKYLALGVAQGLYQNSKEVVQAFDAMLEKLNYQRKLDIIDDAQYYTELEKLRDRYFVAGSREWVKYTEKIYAYEQKLLEKVQKEYEEYKKAYKDTYDDIYGYAADKIGEVMKKQDAYADKLKAYGDLFQKVTIALDDGNIEYYRLSDLKKDTEQIAKYTELMQQVREQVLGSGVDTAVAESFLKEIDSLGIDMGTQVMEGVMRASQSELADYMNAYAQKLSLADGISAQKYSGEMKTATENSYAYMVQKLTEAGFEVPESFFASGTVSAKNFGEAFAKELDIQLGQIKDMIDTFNSKLAIDISPTTATATASPTVNTYNASYHIAPSFGESTHAQLRVVRDYEEFMKMRRGF